MKCHVNWLLESSCFELSGDGKYGLFWAKKLTERWYLLITVLESSCFELSGDGKYSYFLSLKVDGKMIFTDYWKVLVLSLEKFLFWTFRRWAIRSSFEAKSWWKGDVYLVFLSFPRYSRTWEIWFFVQCRKKGVVK